MSDQITSGAAIDTAAACVEFWDAAAEKGWFNKGSARSVRIAFGKVMEIDDGWERIDLRNLDREEQFNRFRTLRRNEYSDGSLKVYRSRFNMAIKTYLARNDDDPEWKSYGPAARGTSPSKNLKPKNSGKPADEAARSKPTGQSDPKAADREPLAPPPSGNTITHVFPLRDNLDVQLVLPRDLTKDEAEWLGTLLATLPRPSTAT